MNTTSLENFKQEVNQIREYLKHIQHVDNMAASTFRRSNKKFNLILDDLKKYYKNFRTDKKIFEYKATIISIYGLLEKYIEIWIKEYLESLSKLIKDYEQLPKNIKTGHFELSLKLITAITSRESAKYQHIKKEQVLSNLNGCIQNPLNYELNTEAFTLSSGNLKHKKIVEILNPILDNFNGSLIKSQILSLHIQKDLNTGNISNLKPEILYSKIDDLVDRRNIIAHGSEVVHDLLDHELLLSYIDFLEKYCQAVFEVFLEKYISHESIYSFKQIETIHGIWDNSILGFEIENYTIKCGDSLIIKTPNNDYSKKEILELHKNKVAYPELKIEKKTKIAIKVEPKISNNCFFYIKIQNKTSTNKL